MKNVLKKVSVFLFVAIVILSIAVPVLALQDDEEDETVLEVTNDYDTVDITDDTGTYETTGESENSSALSSVKAISAAIVIGVVASVGAVAMALSIVKSVDGISRQPEAEGSIRTTMMLGLVFVETAIIYSLVVAILIIFVL